MKNLGNVLVIGFAVVLSVAALFISFSRPTLDQISEALKNVGGQRAGLQEFNDGVKAGDIVEKTISKALPVGEDNVVLYRNTTGRDVYATMGVISIPTGETASTTYRGSILATTSSSVPDSMDFVALSPSPFANLLLIDGTQATNMFATSSTATSTNSVEANSGNGVVIIPDGSYLIGYWQLNFGAATAGRCHVSGIGTGGVGGACESATSTVRGTNPVFQVKLWSPGIGGRVPSL